MAKYKSQQINRGSISDLLQLIQGFSGGKDKGTTKSSFYDTVYGEFYGDIHSSGTVGQVQNYITDLDAFTQKNITKMNDNDIQRFEFLKDQAENQKKLISGFDMSINKVFGENGISNKYIQLLEDYRGASEQDKPIMSNKLGALTLSYIDEQTRINREFGSLTQLPNFTSQFSQLNNLDDIFTQGTILIEDEFLSKEEKNRMVTAIKRKDLAHVKEYVNDQVEMKNVTRKQAFESGFSLAGNINYRQEFLNNVEMVFDKFGYKTDKGYTLNKYFENKEDENNRNIEWENIKGLPAHTWEYIDDTDEKVTGSLTFENILNSDPRVRELQKQYTYDNERDTDSYNRWDASYQNVLGQSFKSEVSHELTPSYTNKYGTKPPETVVIEEQEVKPEIKPRVVYNMPEGKKQIYDDNFYDSSKSKVLQTDFEIKEYYNPSIVDKESLINNIFDFTITPEGHGRYTLKEDLNYSPAYGFGYDSIKEKYVGSSLSTYLKLYTSPKFARKLKKMIKRFHGKRGAQANQIANKITEMIRQEGLNFPGQKQGEK